MQLDVKFAETTEKLPLEFGNVTNVSDGGYERGYNEGYNKGKTEGNETAYNEGVADGKVLQNTEFWENYMGNNKYSFSYAFYIWNEEAFNPNIPLVLKGECTRIFYGFNSTKLGTPNTVDMIALLTKHGGSLDFSNTTDITYGFGSAKISTLPTLDLRSCKKIDNAFNNAPIQKIEKIILKSDGTQTFGTSTFNCRIPNSDYTLQHITFEGKIGTNITFQYCPLLTAESVQSIIDALYDLQANGKATQTITFHKDVTITDTQKVTISQKGWTLTQI